MRHDMQVVRTMVLCVATLIGSTSASSSAQVAASDPHPDWAGVSHVVLPQTRALALERGRDPIHVEHIDAHVDIVECAAVTTLEIAVRNLSARPAEAVLLLPVPAGAGLERGGLEGRPRELGQA